MIAGTPTARLLPRTKPTGRHPQKALSAAFVRSAPPGRHADGNGLYLFVQPSGTRSWIQRLLIRGRRRELGLGSVALAPLSEAREKALANRKLARQGGDPLAEKRRGQGIPSFAEAAMRVLEQKRGGWRNPRHPREWLSSLRRFAFPRIGKVPVSEVTSADLLEILTPLWHRKVATARRVRQRLRAVLEWAVAMEYRIDFRALCDKLIAMSNLNIPLRYRSPHYTHRFESDFAGLSWACMDVSIVESLRIDSARNRRPASDREVPRVGHRG